MLTAIEHFAIVSPQVSFSFIYTAEMRLTKFYSQPNGLAELDLET